MDILILAVIVYIVILFLGYYILKSVIKALFFAGTIFVIISLVLGVLMFIDIKDIQENFQTSSKLMIIESNSEVASAFISANNKAEIVNSSKFPQLSSYLKKKDYESLLDGNYKVIIYSLSAVKEMDNFSIEIAGTAFYRDELVNIMQNEGKAKYWSEKLYIPDYHQLRAAVFAELISKKLTGPENIITFVTGLKTGKIKVYPKTIYFKMMKLLPTSFVEARLKSLS